MGRSEPIRRGTHRAGTQGSEIPDKLYFRIGEVARLCEVPTYVLRFWESEFPQLKPNKGGTGQRLYRRRDVELALRVKTLLKDEGYTIPGARQTLKSELKQKEPQPTLIAGATGGVAPDAKGLDAKGLRDLRSELESLAAMLAKPFGKAESLQKSTSKSRSRAVLAESSVQPIRPPRPEPVPAPLDPIESKLIPSAPSPAAIESTPLDAVSFDPASFAPVFVEPEFSPFASDPAQLAPTQSEPAPADALPALVPLATTPSASTLRARVRKTAPAAGLLFDLFDTPQNSEGDER
jgi:DNA-binding transcriptional MerR regulator